MNYLLIDNYDSFTFNLYQQFLKVSGLSANKLHVLRNDEFSIEQINTLNPAGIIISPGPGGPQDTGKCPQVIQEYSGKVAILGICLGHQLIANLYGASIVRANSAMHGKTSALKHTGEGLFEKLPQNIKVARYHSLIIKPSTLSSDFVVDALCQDVIMAIRHRHLPLYGIQFHPESFLSQYGDQLMLNFFNICLIYATSNTSHCISVS